MQQRTLFTNKVLKGISKSFRRLQTTGPQVTAGSGASGSTSSQKELSSEITDADTINDDPETFLLRQRQFNNSIVEQLRTLNHLPVTDLPQIKAMLNQPLTEREKQLDEELTAFLKEFSRSNNQVQPNSSNTNTNNNNQEQSRTENKTATATANATAIMGQLEKYPYLEPSPADKPYTPQELFLRQMQHASHTAKLGADIKKVYFPQRDVSNPLSVDKITIKKLMEAGVHLGQSTSLWRSSTQPYIYGEYNGIHIIDLNKTLAYLKRAANVIEKIVERGGIVLFLGTREGQKRALEEAAKRVHGYYVSSRWIPGTLTNPTEISGIWEKQEVDFYDRPTGRVLSSEENMNIVKPDLLVVLNPTENRNALREAMKARIPTIGIIDTDSEPSFVTYPIPGNDDSYRSVSLILGVLARAGERGLKTRLAGASN